jgi:hypothetical protein
VVMPTKEPSHQPSQPPRVSPMKPKSLRTDYCP